MRNNRIAPHKSIHLQEEPSEHSVNYFNKGEGVCRICLEEDFHLLKPCACSGSIQFVHENCMKLWINSQGKRGVRYLTCQICQHKIYFSVTTHRECECPNIGDAINKLHSIYVIIFAFCIFCVCILVILLKFARQMKFTKNAQITIIVCLVVTILSTAFLITALLYKCCTKQRRQITKVFSQVENKIREENAIQHRRSRHSVRTVLTQRISNHTSLRAI